jgi:hypothetical protein
MTSYEGLIDLYDAVAESEGNADDCLTRHDVTPAGAVFSCTVKYDVETPTSC